jgi:hypothetical protein
MKKIIGILSVLLLSVASFGQGVVSGHVYEQDGIVPIEGVTIAFSGYSWAGDTLLYEFQTDSLGSYNATMADGRYAVSAFADGYQAVFRPDSLLVGEGQFMVNIDFILHENYTPVRYVAARHFANDFVRLSWSMSEPLLYEDFELGDFSRFNWDNTLSDFPWVVDTTYAYEGAFCMKSTCEGQAEGRSEIEVSVYVPWSGEMRFQSKISSETNWDRGYFYIDNVKMLECSGESDWEEHRFALTEGEHLFRWAYIKDAINDDGDDCFYVDDIHFFVEEGLKTERSFLYYDLFRRRFDEEPTLLASHLTDTVFMEMGWNGLPWGKYQWGVSCRYEGNRAMSDTVWSAYLDKDMTTAFEVFVSTNVGLSASGAEITLHSESNDYQGVVDSNGHLALPNVYRDNYLVSVHLDGFVDYVSDTLVSVMEPTQYEVELREAVKGVDSLYVSSTGWAVWRLSDTLYRNLQYFEIQLDGEFVGATDRMFYQFDVSQMNSGDTCFAQVRPIYLSDTCGWCDCSWVYRSCVDFQPTANGLTSVIRDNGVLLSWNYPANDSVMGAVLYRDGEFLGFVETDSYLDETVEMQGVAEYGLRVVYDGEAVGSYYSMACEETISITFPAFCDPPTKLYAENYLDDNDEYGALVSWGDKPEPNEAWLHYDNGHYKNAVGGGNEPVIFWSIRFDAEDLADYQGTTFRKIALFDVGAGSYQLWIYKGGETAPRTLIHSQNMTLSGFNAWHEESIVPQIEVPENEPVWVVIGQQGVSRPAAVCEDMDDPDGRWVSLNGVDWTDLHTYNMHYTWMLRAFVSDRFGRMLPLGSDSYSLQHYNLYRSYNNSDYQKIAEIPSIEGQQYYQYRDVLLGETHDHFYYKLTAVYLSDENEECESDFAASLAHPDKDYVMVDDAWEIPEIQAENIDVYPNPTDGQLVIEVSKMHQVSVFNALGQCVISVHVNTNVLRLDLSSFDNGAYLLRVVTENGMAMRRFVVSR